MTQSDDSSLRIPKFRAYRGWFPFPNRHGRMRIIRWILLEGNRIAVTIVLLLGVFATLLGVGLLWTFEMHVLLAETRAVENILDTFIAGIMLLVPLVVSITAIALSHDITSIETQQRRVHAVMDFRKEIGRLSKPHHRPSDPASFLEAMATVIRERSVPLAELVEHENEAFVDDVTSFIESLESDVEPFENAREARERGSRFGVLWMGMEFDYGGHVDNALMIRDEYYEERSEAFDEQLDFLLDGFQQFAVGKEYFKSLYYTQELSRLSRTLLIASLPTIMIAATAILAINQELLPGVWVLGLPPLLTFMAAVVTISLIPFLLLTSYMLRLATVAIRTSTGGPFWLD